MSLAGATMRERNARAKLAELAYRKQRRQVIPLAEVKRSWADYIVPCKTKIRGLVSRAKQRLPHLTASDVAVLAELIDEALTELAEE
jgi:phage terminase Nu1 subunit (DNA packaging protein)